MIEYIALTNFLSFKDRTEISLKATKEKPRGALSENDWWTSIDGHKILKTAFLLGNNGSGKTNFLNSLSMLNDFITNKRTSKSATRQKLVDLSFKFSPETIGKPSTIEIAFYTCGFRYEYLISWDIDHICNETLYRQEGKKQKHNIFNRTYDNHKELVTVEFPKKTTISTEAQNIIVQNVLKNTSVVSVYDSKNFECEDLRNLHNYFKYVDLWNVKNISLASMITQRTNEQLLKPILLCILKDMGSTIRDYKVDTISIDILPDEKAFLLNRMSEEEFNDFFPNGKRTQQNLQFGYRIKGQDETSWLSEDLESEGTLEAIRLIILLFDSLWRNVPIAIDECAQSIHPKSLEYILSFFLNSSETTQVFFATQALYLLKWEDLRRDTIRFFNKDKYTGCSSIELINSRKQHKNTQIYDLYMNKTFGGETYIMDKTPWKEHLIKLSECMKAKEWKE